MNILFVINSIEPGGAEVFLLRFAKALMEKNNNVYIFAIHSEKSNAKFQQLFEDSKIPILQQYSGPVEWKEKLFWKMNALLSFIGVQGIYVKLKRWEEKKFYQKLLKKHNILVINSHLFEADNFAVNYLKKIGRLPVVLTMHSSYNKEAIQKQENAELFIKKAGSVLNQADYITYLTNDNKYIFDLISGKLKTPIQQIYLGYEKPDVEVSPAFFQNKFTFGMMGRGIKEKGWEEALSAFKVLVENHNNVQLILICPITNYIEDLKLKFECENIRFMGYLDKPELILQNVKVMLLPSYGESLPVTIIESLAFGVPVIASNVGEIYNMLSTENGEIAGDVINLNSEGKVCVDELKIVMESYLLSPDKLNEKQQMALLAAKKFSMEKCVGSYLSIFNTLTK